MSAQPLPRPGEKLPQRQIGPFSAEDLARYARASGDDNPLHLDAELARAVGFPARPAHGMRILAAFEPFLADWRPDLRLVALKGQFLTPLLEGEAALLSGRIAKVETDPPRVIVRLAAHSAAGPPVLIGEARLSST